MKKVDKKLGLGLLFVFALTHIMPTLSMDEERAQRHGLGQPLLQPVEGGEGYVMVQVMDPQDERNHREGQVPCRRRWFRRYGDIGVSLAATALAQATLGQYEGDVTPDILAHISGETISHHTPVRNWKTLAKTVLPTVGLAFGVTLVDGYLLLPLLGIRTKIGMGLGIAGLYQLIDFFKDHDSEREKLVQEIMGLDAGQRERVARALSVAHSQGEVDRVDPGILGQIGILERRIAELEEVRRSAVFVDMGGSEEGSGGPSSDTTLGSSPRQEQLAAGVLAAARAAGEQVEEIGFDPGDGVRSPASLSEEDEG